MKPGYCQRPIPESGSTPSCADAVQAMAKASRARRAMPLQPSKRQLEAKPSCELNKDWAGRKADTPARIADSPASEGRPKTSAPAEAPAATRFAAAAAAPPVRHSPLSALTGCPPIMERPGASGERSPRNSPACATAERRAPPSKRLLTGAAERRQGCSGSSMAALVVSPSISMLPATVSEAPETAGSADGFWAQSAELQSRAN